MKVLSIGMDKELLKKDSPAFLRHIEYAKKVEEYHAIVFARKKYGSEKVEISKNAWSYPTNSSNTLTLFVNAFLIGRKKLKQKGDWVITAQDPFESGVVAFFLSKVTGVPFQVQEHGDFFGQTFWKNESILNTLRFHIGKFILRHAHGVRVVAKRIKKTLVDFGVKEDKIIITPVYTDLEAFINATPDDEIKKLKTKNEIIFLTMARFVPQKNLSLLIRSFIKALKKESDVKMKLVIVGKGEEEKKLKKLAKDAPKGSIVFMDWTDNPASVIKSADVYALSSNYEGWGRVCIETMASGTPLLMTNVGCANEVVLDGINGLVVPVNDEWVFAEGLHKLAIDKELRKRLSKDGLVSIKSLPIFEENVSAYIEGLERCLKIKEKK